ncbi:TetR/AcrR family transcriptional regulator [Gordonia sp. HY285]|uniref:TetR/AcrR family transcriptional regulator n=1 Tax=Gordonia liuliyuniae TaxID=2911517 RepID=UPI001F2CA9A3|nr:TetR/AcrR family transcriptional regulator [Gordonia liuliyuniae]MCF8609068.1 TetR/AcrR family transcriptional regulator [Gordonia liuliyuniae]
MMTTAGGRTYGGLTAEDRQLQRRESLIAAGLQLFGTLGYPNVSVKRICTEAGLTQRYFYESFGDRAALLGEVYNHCVDIARAATLAAAAEVLEDTELTDGPIPDDMVPALAEQALRGFITSLTEDTRRARIIMIEVVGVSPELEMLRLRAIHGWADLILGFAARGHEPTADQRLGAIGLVGALTQLLVDWQTALDAPIEPGYDLELFDIDAIHRVVTATFVATYQQLFHD